MVSGKFFVPRCVSHNSGHDCPRFSRGAASRGPVRVPDLRDREKHVEKSEEALFGQAAICSEYGVGLEAC